ncbi:hypothetical protein [Gryllotalpicola kribbensis]|uniref:hypothetical protein n=1 Tax=Gryllotalpicola kribbensis TaxID=993084 RepID=UPI0031D32979
MIGAAIHTGVAAIGAVVVTLVTLGLLIFALAQAASGSGTTDASGDSDFGFGKAFRLAFGWLLSLAFGGNVHISSGIDLFGSSARLGATLHGAPVLLTAGVLALTIWSGIRIEKRVATPTWVGRLATSAATGLVAAAIISILAASFGHGSTGASGNDFFSADAHLAAGGPGVFFTGWLLIGLAAFLGRQFGAWGGLRLVTANAPAVVRDLTVWGTALGTVFGVLALAAGVILGIRADALVGTLLTIPLWLGQATVYAITLGHFGSLAISTGGLGDALSSFTDDSDLPTLDQHFNVFNVGGLVPGGGLVWILFGFAVLVTLWSGLRIGVLRAARPTSLPQRGLFVGIATLSALLIPVLVTNLRLSVSGAAEILKSIGASLHGGFGAAAWVFLVFAVVAVLIDLIATYVTPLVAVTFPPLINVASVGITDAQGTPAPLSPAAKKATIWAGSIVGGLAVLAGLFFGAVAVLNHTVFTPEKPVAQYAGLIASGDFTDAAKIASPGRDALNAKPEKTISNVVVTADRPSGDQALVKVAYRLDGRSYSQQVRVTKHDKGLFNSWKVATPLASGIELTSDASSSTSAKVGGSALELGDSGGAASMTVFPGIYKVVPDGGEYLTADAFTVAAGDEGGARQSIEWSFTPAVTETLQKLVDDSLDTACFGDDDDSTQFYCYLVSDTQRNDENASWWDTDWSNVKYPAIKLAADGSFTTTTPGTAKAAWKDTTYDDDFNEVETDKSANEDYFVYGDIRIDGSELTIQDQSATTDEDELPDASDDGDS